MFHAFTIFTNTPNVSSSTSVTTGFTPSSFNSSATSPKSKSDGGCSRALAPLTVSPHGLFFLSGYNVTKYVPYGPVKKVIPYLIRRADENTSISGQMGRELSNIIKERRRRNN